MFLPAIFRWSAVLALPVVLVVSAVSPKASLFAQPQSEGPVQVVPDATDKDYSSELPRIPASSPAEALASLEALSGFTVELVAAEPLISDPVAFAFNAKGHLFVVEMRDYSEQADEHLGRIARLVDLDGDGVYDERTTFVEGLSWPTAIWPWRDGVLVAEPPRITWYRDQDQDGICDSAEDWFVGFARSNVQGLVNSLRWGVDGYIHGATSSSGATVELAAAQGSPISLGRRDFAIDPLDKSLRPQSGGGQHGLSFNRWGDKFVTSNSDHLQQIVDIESWLGDHPSRVPMPGLRRSIAEDGPQAEVFRASPVEPWRIVRTRLRVSGVTPGIVEGGGRASGYFTGATGTCILDDRLGFGVPGHDTALVCDVGSNLVHRKQLSQRGLFWTSARIDQGTELLRSRDIWFRPVQLGDGPDGAVYIADMAREVIEHPQSLPPMIKKHLDLTSGRELGRIWRLAPVTLKPTDGERNVDLSELDSSALIERLGHAIPWQRLMASQILLERGEDGLPAEALREYIATSDSSVGRLLALHVANRLKLADADWLRPALRGAEPRLVATAVKLVNELSLVGEVEQELIALVDREGSLAANPHVQLELAMLAAVLPEPLADHLLSRLVARSDEPLLQAVIATAAGDRAWRLVRMAWERDISETHAEATGNSWLKLLLPVWSQQLATSQENADLREWIQAELQPGNQRLSNWLDVLSNHGNFREAAVLWRGLPDAQRTVLKDWIHRQLKDLSHDMDEDQRLAWVVWLDRDLQQAWLEQSLLPSVNEGRQRALIVALARGQAEPLWGYLLQHMREFTPRVQEHALRALVGAVSTQRQLAETLESGELPISLVTAEFRQQLSGGSDEGLAARFKNLFAATTSERAEVLSRYRDELNKLAGSRSTDPADESGEQVFRRACAQCHQLNGIGIQVGPPLQQLSDKSAEQLLEAILDPNREVDPRYTGYGVMMNDGRLLTGIIRDESASQIVLQEAGGTTHTVVRSDIDQLKSSGLSLMPVGLEAQVTPQQMQVLIEFLRGRK
jgi:putative membrane-bound dehydrogenase-like protein